MPKEQEPLKRKKAASVKELEKLKKTIKEEEKVHLSLPEDFLKNSFC